MQRNLFWPLTFQHLSHHGSVSYVPAYSKSLSHLTSCWQLANFLPARYFLERCQETEITGSVLPTGLVTGCGAMDHPPCIPDVMLSESSFYFPTLFKQYIGTIQQRQFAQIKELTLELLGFCTEPVLPRDTVFTFSQSSLFRNIS